MMNHLNPTTSDNGYTDKLTGQPSFVTVANFPLPRHRSIRTGEIPRHRIPQIFSDSLAVKITSSDRAAVKAVSQVRPQSLRSFDQIPMRPLDLIRQVKLMAPYLAGKSVVFLGDHDGTSLLLGILSRDQAYPKPKSMLILDFDERLLVAARKLAIEYGFSDLLETQLYNVFDPVPSDLVGRFDWFYTNPPYGCRNQGESARLFIARCCELACPQYAKGCIIIPDAENRPWTSTAMDTTDYFLHQYGWTIHEKLNQMHQYQLDDDQELASSVILVKRSSYSQPSSQAMSYVGRRVDFSEIPHFYGLTVNPPYPRYIMADDSESYWPEL